MTLTDVIRSFQSEIILVLEQTSNFKQKEDTHKDDGVKSLDGHESRNTENHPKLRDVKESSSQSLQEECALDLGPGELWENTFFLCYFSIGSNVL